MTPNQLKLFVVQNDRLSCKLIEIPTNLSTNEYIDEVVLKLQSVNDLMDLRYVLFMEYGGHCFFYNFEENPSQPIGIYGISNDQIPSPALMNVLRNSDKFIQSGKATNMNFVETDLFQGFPELKTMQIRGEGDVKKFVDFVINKLDVNFNPDDPFENFFEAGETKTFQGIVCVITQEDIDFLNATVEDCAAITGDDFYDISLEILNVRLGLSIGVGGVEDFDGSDYLDNRTKSPGASETSNLISKYPYYSSTIVTIADGGEVIKQLFSGNTFLESCEKAKEMVNDDSAIHSVFVVEAGNQGHITNKIFGKYDVEFDMSDTADNSQPEEYWYLEHGFLHNYVGNLEYENCKNAIGLYKELQAKDLTEPFADELVELFDNESTGLGSDFISLSFNKSKLSDFDYRKLCQKYDIEQITMFALRVFEIFEVGVASPNTKDFAGSKTPKEPLKVGSTYVLDDIITGNHINFPARDDFRPGTKLLIQKIPKNKDSIIAYEVEFEDDSYSFSKEEFFEKTHLSV